MESICQPAGTHSAMLPPPMYMTASHDTTTPRKRQVEKTSNVQSAIRQPFMRRRLQLTDVVCNQHQQHSIVSEHTTVLIRSTQHKSTYRRAFRRKGDPRPARHPSKHGRPAE